MIRAFKSNEHHCTSAECLRAIVSRLGYTPDEEREEGAVLSVLAKEKAPVGRRPAVKVSLDKTTDVLSINWP
jgi:hypothetical protein